MRAGPKPWLRPIPQTRFQVDPVTGHRYRPTISPIRTHVMCRLYASDSAIPKTSVTSSQRQDSIMVRVYLRPGVVRRIAGVRQRAGMSPEEGRSLSLLASEGDDAVGLEGPSTMRTSFRTRKPMYAITGTKSQTQMNVTAALAAAARRGGHSDELAGLAR